MQIKYFLVFFILLVTASVNAQTLLKGTVYDNNGNTKLPDVFIRDNNNKQLALTDNDGNFTVKTETGHTLIFDLPGYISDTLYIVDLSQKKILLTTKTIALKEVSVNATRSEAFDPHKEYPDVYEKSKVYIMSPTTWFSKEGKDARRLKHYFAKEAQERQVDAVFTRSYVGSIVPLKGEELENFMTLYRPTYAFIKSNNSESLAVYINDSYKKYQALPPDKRTLQTLPNQ
jgi:hypothetical protein